LQKSVKSEAPSIELKADCKIACFGGASCTKIAEKAGEMVSQVTGGPQVQQIVDYIVALTEKKTTVLMNR